MNRILRHFAPDAVFESPRGPERWGERFAGGDALAGAFASRFACVTATAASAAPLVGSVRGAKK